MQSTGYSCQILIKTFHENMSSGSRVVPCGRTDRHKDMTRLIVTFLISQTRLKAPITHLYSIQRLVCTVKTKRVYCAVRTESLHTIQIIIGL